jgi:broad specificity phosphatase PhoE
MRVYFIRHAESTANAHGDRSRDAPLSERGIEQAKSLSGFSHTVICSTLTRAKQTLQHSQLAHHRLIYTPLCREIRRGNPCDYFEDEDQGQHESVEEIDERVRQLRDLISSIRAESQAEVISIVSHHCFIGHITNVWPANAEIVPWASVGEWQ